MEMKTNIIFVCILAMLLTAFAYFAVNESINIKSLPLTSYAGSVGTASVFVMGNVSVSVNLTSPGNQTFNATFSFKSATRQYDANATDGNLSVQLYTDDYNITMSAMNSYLGLNLSNVPVWENKINALKFDNISSSTATLMLPSGYEFTNVYAVETTFSYDNAELTLKYDNPSQVSESDLKPYRCANYNFNSRTCSGSWALISTYSQDTAQNTFSFNLSSLFGFAIGAQIPSVVITPTGGGGGVAKEIKLSFDKEVIKVKLIQGTERTETFKIKNGGTDSLQISLEAKNLENFLSIEDKKFKLEKGESRTIVLSFKVPLSQAPDVYVGKLLVKADGKTIEIPVVIEVVTKGPLFDVLVEISEQFKKVNPGSEIMARVIIYNLERFGSIDIKIEYFIKDIEGNIIESIGETAAIETQLSIAKSLKIPEETKSGTYVFYVKVTSKGIIGLGSDTFKIAALPKKLSSQDIWIIILILAIIIMFAITWYNQQRIIKGTVKKYGYMKSEQLLGISRAEAEQERMKKIERQKRMAKLYKLEKP